MQTVSSPDEAQIEWLTVRWIHGSRSHRNRTDPPIQVYAYRPDTIIMRESKDISHEAPFMYLFLGKKKALLLDTGATADPNRFPLRKTVDSMIKNWVSEHPCEKYELIVAHTHGHNDHTAGDIQFSDRPDTVVVQKDVDSVRSFFNISNWPQGTGYSDLGGRLLEIIPTPGHDSRQIAVYDPKSQLLVSGDTVYPGRLYAFDFQAFVESLNKLVLYSKTHPVSHVVGCHIEMTMTPKKDYPIKAHYQPNEPPLEMTVIQLKKIRDAAISVQNKPGAHVFDDFIIFNGPCYRAVMKELIRGWLFNVKYRLA